LPDSLWLSIDLSKGQPAESTYLVLDQLGFTYQNRTVARAALSTLAITLLMLPLFKQGALRQKIGGVLLAVVVAAWAISLTGSDMLFKYQSDRIERAYLSTAYYNVSMRRYWRPFHDVDVKGGGITTLGDKFLVATGDGYLYQFDFASDGEIRSESLGLLAPFNATVFAEDAPDSIKTRRFRVAGIASQPAADGGYEIYLSHHYWLAEQQCFVARVSRTIASHATLSAAASKGLDWETVYESSPCLPIVSEGEPFFLGLESGGAMVFTDSDTMLLSLGDHAFDGVDGVDNHTIGNVLTLAYAMADDGDDLRDFRGTCQFVHRMAC